MDDRRDYAIASPSIIDKHVVNCPKCGEPLADTGMVKLMAPVLNIMLCHKCKLEYWRKSV